MPKGIKKDGTPRKPRNDRKASLWEDTFTYNPDNLRELKGEAYAKVKNEIRLKVNEQLKDVDFTSFPVGKSYRYIRGQWLEVDPLHKQRYLENSSLQATTQSDGRPDEEL